MDRFLYYGREKLEKQDRNAYHANYKGIWDKCLKTVPAGKAQKGKAEYNSKVPQCRVQGLSGFGWRRHGYFSGCLFCCCVQGKQRAEEHSSSDYGVYLSGIQPAVKGTKESCFLKIKRNTDGQEDSNAIDKNRIKVRASQADAKPQEALTAGIHPMGEGKDQHGSRKDHKLCAGAGSGNNKLTGMIDISDLRNVLKGKPG